MNRIRLTAAAAAMLTALVAAGALTAAPPNKAKSLALRTSDFPPGAKVTAASGDSTAAGSGYGATFRYRTGGKPNELSVAVAVFKSRSVAVQMFRDYRSEMTPGVPKLALPRYGDEQAANFSVLGGSQLIVRRGSVVWVLELQTFMTEHELTEGEAIAEYKRYAPKQQRRIG